MTENGQLRRGLAGRICDSPSRDFLLKKREVHKLWALGKVGAVMKPVSIKLASTRFGARTDSEERVSGVAVDSRLVRGGDLFFALKGAKADGHAFLAQAVQKGAKCAVVDRSYDGSAHGLVLIRSDDVLGSLQSFAASVIREQKPRVVGITGSLGKTTTKDFTVALLQGSFRAAASPGNSNSQIGLPLAILNRPADDDEILVLEMGMTHPGQIECLVKIAPPEVAVVTKVALVHAANFESIEGIARAKAEIFSHPATKSGIYHKESDIGGLLRCTGLCAKSAFSSTDPNVGFYLELSAGAAVIVESGSNGKPIRIRLPQLPVPGTHNWHNFLAAASVARYFGVEWADICRRLATLHLPERRLEQIEKDGVVFINDAYNASEHSVKAALESLPEPQAGGRRIAVLGEMAELGKFSEECHRAVGEHALKYVDAVYCFGEGCKAMKEVWEAAGRQVIWGRERCDIVPLLKNEIKRGDVVLLKGSRSKEVNKVIEELA